MLSLVAMAAAMATALIGATSASAAPIDICLFTKGEAKTLDAAGCNAVGGTIHTEEKGKPKVTFKAKAANPVLAGALSEKCNESNSTSVTKADGTPGLEVTALSFTGACSPCSSVDTFAPYNGSVIMEGENYFLKSSGSAKLLGCPFGVTCKFGSTNITLKYVPGPKHLFNEFRAEKETLNLEEGSALICGSTGTWTANYVVSEPVSWFLFLLP
jgi:hypothetical protein